MTGGARDWFSRQLLGLHLLAVVLVVICVLMGLWQLGVYGAKHEDEAAAARKRAPVELLKVWGPDAPLTAEVVDRPVLVRGTFVDDQVLVSRGDGKYWTVAPLRVSGTRSLLLVVRGWSGLDTPALPKGSMVFKATVQPSEPSQGLNGSTTGSYPSLSIPALANVFSDDLFSGYAVTADRSVSGGLKPVTIADPPVSWTVGLRNLAYALQWWVFGLFAVFMWWRMATDLIEVRRTPTDDLVP